MAARLEDLHRSFARHLRAEGCSPRTVVVYGQAIRFFSEWLTAQGRPATLDELTRAAAREWLAQLADRNELSTVRTRYKGMARFCNWLVGEEELTASPLAGIAAPDAPAKPVAVLSDADLAALMKACAGKDFPDRRDEAMIRVLLDCGVRVSELCGLTVDGLDLDAGMAMVRGKGDKVRPIYMGARTIRALDRYLRLRRTHRWSHLDALFLSQRGAMTPDGVRDRLRTRATQAGLDDLHPHRFRHTFAHDFLMNGGQERDLKRLAGWSSDVMLERYGASAADARARAAAQRMKRGDRV
ncbi:integrase [Actinotalea ferrariae CF5-4]|uniref:Integrase n=1 Tax=Actinotalea ferrariae CF5-4 TaxID=948458 RepID=A0A021VLL7_9CELL|nr:tyrosine-type recombinase/integrase [Actinotalea ferrariae]EYR62071.1 integrase [Actinotalea ferrariae CF5-4]